MRLPGDTIVIPLNWMLSLSRGHFVLLKSLNQKAKKGVTVLAGVTDSDYSGEIGLLPYSGNKEESVWNTPNPLGHFLVLLCAL